MFKLLKVLNLFILLVWMIYDFLRILFNVTLIQIQSRLSASLDSGSKVDFKGLRVKIRFCTPLR